MVVEFANYTIVLPETAVALALVCATVSFVVWVLGKPRR